MRMFINCSEPVYAESHQLFAERSPRSALSLDAGGQLRDGGEYLRRHTDRPRRDPDARCDRPRCPPKRSERCPGRCRSPNSLVKVSCGQPIHGVEVRALDAEGQPLPDRFVGEVVVRSDSMLSGYYKRPDLQPFRDGWYLTGDRGYLANGEVYIVGAPKT